MRTNESRDAAASRAVRLRHVCNAAGGFERGSERARRAHVQVLCASRRRPSRLTDTVGRAPPGCRRTQHKLQRARTHMRSKATHRTARARRSAWCPYLHKGRQQIDMCGARHTNQKRTTGKGGGSAVARLRRVDVRRQAGRLRTRGHGGTVGCWRGNSDDRKDDGLRSVPEARTRPDGRLRGS